ncbi:MAG: L-2-amino-thiazoline-4-carboxylic acid hydrolase [Omnitrophica WOR_2 bacterium]
MKTVHRDNQGLLLGLGVAAGAAAGFILGRRPGEYPWMPAYNCWEAALAEKHGRVRAALLAAKIQSRYEDLYAHRPPVKHPALQMHLTRNILPGLALYQTLLEETPDKPTALAEVERLFRANLLESDLYRQARLLEILPEPFAFLRIANRWTLAHNFPPQGWEIEWVEDSPDCIAYNITDCFYLRVLSAYGAPELTPYFCASDDQLFGNLKAISWERTKTLGRGDELCDFCLRRKPAAEYQ